MTTVAQLATRIAIDLGLAATPTVYTIPAHISPMVWWNGGRVKILIPGALLTVLDHGDLELVLAHEMAHVRRRD